MKYLLLMCFFYLWSMAYGGEKIWSLGVDIKDKSLIVEQIPNPDDTIKVTRGEWDLYERLHKTFQSKLPEGKILQPKNIQLSGVPFRLNGQFMIPDIDEQSVNRWILVNRDGYQVGSIEVFLSDAPKYLRWYLLFRASDFRALKAGVDWVRDKVEEGGTWAMYLADFEDDRIALVGIRGNLGVLFREDNVEQARFNCEDMQEFFQLLLGEKAYDVAGDDLKMALAKDRKRCAVRQQVYQDNLRKELEKRELARWENDPCYGLPMICKELLSNTALECPATLLKHTESLVEDLMMPNIHEGKVTVKLLEQWGGKKFSVVARDDKRNGLHVILTPKMAIWPKGTHIEILTAHARSRKEAMDLLLRLRFYEPTNTGRDTEDMAASTVMNPRKVGDFDMNGGSVLGADGSLLKDSEESAVYFLRGNTAVMVISTYPGYSVLSMARKLDDALQKKKVE